MYALFDKQKADKLLDANSLGDMKPLDMLAYMRGLDSLALLKRVWLRTFPTKLRKQVANAGLNDLDDIAARADHIQETIHGEQVSSIESSHNVSSFRHQHGGKPKRSTKRKRAVLFS